MLYLSMFLSSGWYILLKWAVGLILYTSVLYLSIRQGKQWHWCYLVFFPLFPWCRSACHLTAASAFLVNSFHITFSPAMATHLWQFFPAFLMSRFKLCSHFLLGHSLRPFPLSSACQASTDSLSLLILSYALPISFCFRLFSMCVFSLLSSLNSFVLSTDCVH